MTAIHIWATRETALQKTPGAHEVLHFHTFHEATKAQNQACTHEGAAFSLTGLQAFPSPLSQVSKFQTDHFSSITLLNGNSLFSQSRIKMHCIRSHEALENEVMVRFIEITMATQCLWHPTFGQFASAVGDVSEINLSALLRQPIFLLHKGRCHSA